MAVGEGGVINNVIKVKKTDFEVFDALKTDCEKTADMSGKLYILLSLIN